MAKLPRPPSVATLRTMDPPVCNLPSGTWLARIGFAGGDHPSAWNEWRNWGPHGARFDHHLPDSHGQPHLQDRGILYAARHVQTCLAEVFQDTRVVDVTARQPFLAVWRTRVALQLLDLSGAFATRIGASAAIHSGPRHRVRPWAVAIHDAWPQFDGIAYCSAMNGNADAFALTERARAKQPFPPFPDSLRMLADPLIADELDAAAQQVGYLVAR